MVRVTKYLNKISINQYTILPSTNVSNYITNTVPHVDSMIQELTASKLEDVYPCKHRPMGSGDSRLAPSGARIMMGLKEL